MATAEDMRVLLERIGGVARALMEQQARAHQAAPALQALQRQQTAQQAQRWAAAAQALAHGGTAVVDTRLLWKSVVFDGRVTLEVVQVPIRSSQWSHRPSICWCRETKDVAAMRATHKDLDTRAQRTAVRHADDGAPKRVRRSFWSRGPASPIRRAVRRGCQPSQEGGTGAQRHHVRRTEDPLLCCTPHAFRTSSWCEEVRSVLITRQALGQGRTHVHGHRRSRCEVRQIW